MINKIKYLIFFFAFTSLEALSQAKLEFQKSDHDFGNVAEGTLATHDFTFTNTGNEPLLINNVSASCGCTTPYWTKEPVLPGNQGKITASYDSKNRPGAFNKSITITSNAEVPSTTLFIKGVVVTKENITKVFSDEEIANSPQLQIEKNVIQTGKVEKGQSIPVSMVVKNSGKSDLSINQVKAPCNCIRLDGNSGKIIKPGKSETVQMVFTAQNIGTKTETVTVYSNDIRNPEHKFSLEAEVVESLSNKSILKEKQSAF